MQFLFYPSQYSTVLYRIRFELHFLFSYYLRLWLRIHRDIRKYVWLRAIPHDAAESQIRKSRATAPLSWLTRCCWSVWLATSSWPWSQPLSASGTWSTSDIFSIKFWAMDVVLTVGKVCTLDASQRHCISKPNVQKSTLQYTIYAFLPHNGRYIYWRNWHL
jgi:hypothetical protein